jgi:hypothetical protein
MQSEGRRADRVAALRWNQRYDIAESSEELSTRYYDYNEINEHEMGGTWSTQEEIRFVYNILVENALVNRRLWSPRSVMSNRCSAAHRCAAETI